MTKAGLVNSIAKSTGIERAVVLKTIQTTMDTIKESLGNGKNVYFRGFGSFVVKKRAQKTGRNITKNTPIIIPAHNVPTFKPVKTFVTEVKTKVKTNIK